MKITSVKTAATVGHCMHLWVRVETDAGITGLGECVHGGHQAIAIIEKEMAAMLIGRDPFAIDAIFEDIRRSLVFEGGFAGALITALTGVEIALWDLKGKALEVPVYELMGGKFRDDIRVYCDCEVSPGMNMDEVQREVDQVLEAGFKALKVDLDIRAYGHTGSETGWYVKDKFNMTPNKWEHDRMVELAEMVVKAAGKDVEVACDLHTRLDKHSAIRLARDLEHLQLMWLEEPIPPENIDVMAEITRSTSTPICAGENLYLRHGFRKLLEQQAVDIIMPDIPKCGGLSECRKIAELADLYSIPFAPHNVSSPIGTMASAHVCATIPNFLVLEFHWFHRDYWSTITDGGDIIRDGKIKLSDRPGIGLELNEDVARAHQYPGTTWFA
ncbi:Starvation-sensing protein RspA [Devosia equisanguinis]|uniref:Starvation-sensing protein RspA n=1 Tax=Devosia equisanguinis TaxID=2490941 RepID=A0A3S5D3G1_9HYPH|nr:mandelate racemase/muconate lactonizing enzyme family protein [Devosia equisanguinis]VDS05024.1 Starvation-sensing protein RspA [Devosia equisanguinis]